MANDMTREERKQNPSSIRIFKNPFLESLTHVHPITPLLVWGPFIVYLFYRSLKVHDLSISVFLALAPLGLLIWTISEYLLHRFVFHFPAKSKAGKYFVFLFHGLHHDDPADGTRLVMPPVPAALFIFILYHFYGLFFSTQMLPAFMGWFLIGYLIYDYIHYATHHFPMKNKVARYLKAYHLKHHYSGEASRYGVSSPLWDYLLGTVTGPKKEGY
jgi:sterol desaturase/sphingolipid hydroxylase (fatty acid hydroxylase superfamily)